MTENEGSKIMFDTSLGFKKKSQRYSQQLDAMANTHGRLQEHGLVRHKAQHYLDVLHATIRTYKNRPSHRKFLHVNFKVLSYHVSIGNN